MRARENPFAAHRVEALAYRFEGGSWSDALADLEALGWRGAVVGPHGSGKTTLLEQLLPRLEQKGFRPRSVRLTAGEKRLGHDRKRTLFAAPDPDDFLVVDGADELAAMVWLDLVRRSGSAAGLVISVHRPARLPTWRECEPTVALLADLVADLHRRCDCQLPPMERLFFRQGGDLRAALWDLYDFHAGFGQTEPAPGRGRTNPFGRASSRVVERFPLR